MIINCEVILTYTGCDQIVKEGKLPHECFSSEETLRKTIVETIQHEYPLRYASVCIFWPNKKSQRMYYKIIPQWFRNCHGKINFDDTPYFTENRKIGREGLYDIYKKKSDVKPEECRNNTY